MAGYFVKLIFFFDVLQMFHHLSKWLHQLLGGGGDFPTLLTLIACLMVWIMFQVHHLLVCWKIVTSISQYVFNNKKNMLQNIFHSYLSWPGSLGIFKVIVLVRWGSIFRCGQESMWCRDWLVRVLRVSSCGVRSSASANSSLVKLEGNIPVLPLRDPSHHPSSTWARKQR